MQCMEVKLGLRAVSMTNMNKNGLRHFLTKKDFFTSQTIQCKNVTLRMHVHVSISVTTMNQKWPLALFYTVNFLIKAPEKNN